uniref:Uncharacterized protein n=1 Tax=Eptatretus burgeri TaxID=7764 RepID=A0A8C4Q1V5_EPTBU
MRKFAYCKVVLATSLVWVLVDAFLLLYFSECNKCEEKKERGLLPALGGELAYVVLCPLSIFSLLIVIFPFTLHIVVYCCVHCFL